MNMPQSTPERGRLHPLLILAAIAVILFSVIGTAAIMGWLPSSHGTARDGLSDAERAALAANTQPIDSAHTPYTAAPVPGGAAPAPAPAPYTATPYNQQALAGGNAYGYSGMQGATSSGGPAPAPAPVYVPEEKPYVPPKTQHHTTRVANADADSHWCASCGNIESVRAITSRARGSGVGAGGGAILGGLLGNQIGSGHGRQLATVAGAVGGAVIGNQVEGNMRASTSYEIRVRLDDGTLRTFHQQSAPQWRTGDRVRIVKGTLRSA